MKKIAQSPLPKFDDKFHKMINPPRKVLYTMVARRKPPQQQQANSSQKPDDQQQQRQSSSSSLAFPSKIKERLNFDDDHQHVQQQQQPSSSSSSSEGVGQLQQGVDNRMVMDQQQQQNQQQDNDDEINVTTCTTTGSLVEYAMTPSPVQNRPPRRAAAQTAAQRFEHQVKPKRQRAVQQQQQSSSVASPPTPPTAKTGKQIRQQRKNANRKANPRVLISVDSNVPAKVQPIVVNDRRKYSVDAVLAVFTLPRPPPEFERRGYYLKWRGFTNQESWVLSQDAYCLEMAAAFSEKIGLDASLDAMLGNEIAAHLLSQLQQSEKFAQVRELYNVPALREARFDIAWSETATPQDRRKAVAQLPAFIKIMEETPPTTNEEEEEEDD